MTKTLKNSRKTLIIVLLLSLHGKLYSQQTFVFQSFNPIGIQTDANGNIYLWNENILRKTDKHGTLVCEFSKKTYGTIFSVDASNPLKIIVFYKDRNVLVFLDSRFKELNSPLQLDVLELTDITLVCSGARYPVWCFDNSTRSIYQISHEAKIINQTMEINKLIDCKNNPNTLIEFNGKLFVNIPHCACIIFNQNASMERQIMLVNNIKFSVSEKTILNIIDSQTVRRYDYVSNAELKFPLPGVASTNFFVTNREFFHLKNDTVIQYMFSDVFINTIEK